MIEHHADRAPAAQTVEKSYSTARHSLTGGEGAPEAIGAVLCRVRGLITPFPTRQSDQGR